MDAYNKLNKEIESFIDNYKKVHNQNLIDRHKIDGTRDEARQEYENENDIIWIDRRIYDILAKNPSFIPSDNILAGIKAFAYYDPKNSEVDSPLYSIKIEDFDKIKNDNLSEPPTPPPPAPPPPLGYAREGSATIRKSCSRCGGSHGG